MKFLAIALVGIAFTTAVSAATADADLSTAKNLYASAAYEDALAVLSRVATASQPRDLVLQVDEYRSLCLYALGRTSDAEAAVKDLLEKDPLYELANEDVSPRVQAMFAEVRKHMLPNLARERFRTARAAVDAKEFAKAESELSEVQRIIAEARRVDANDETLPDLATLTDGFRELAHASLVAAQKPAVAAPTPPPPAPAATTPPAARTYTVGDADVTPPAALVQTIPPVPAELMAVLHSRQGVLELTIDSNGRVAAAAMRQSLNSAYDEMVVSAAKLWRYRPAVKDGVPVRYVKAILLDVKAP